ncbi:MAG: hypothetical protein JWO89_2568 [Verrucomicrobiaceae bacterium]|nr:hypothetical protein [Verrucomicrobiaceae bacterium]
MNVPTPRELFRQFETGQISRADFQAAMAEHQKELIEEMDEAYRNPLAAFVDQVYNRAAAFVLVCRHGESTVREVLNALGDLHDFPPARHLWNALHTHVPLFCFFRTKTEPLFRILKMETKAQLIVVTVEHGSAAKGGVKTEEIRLRRLRTGQWIEDWRR